MEFKKALKVADLVSDRVISATGQFAAVLLMCIALFVFANVVSRLLGKPLPWLFDMTTFSMVVFAFVAAAYGLREGAHVSVELIRAQLTEENNAILDVGVYIIAICFFVVLGWNAGLWVYDSYVYGVKSATSVVKFPMWPVISALPFGCFLLSVQSLKIIVSRIPDLPKNLFKTASPRLIDRPYMILSTTILAIIIGIALLYYVHMLPAMFLFLLILLFGGMPVAFALGTIGCFGLYILFGSGQFTQIPILAFQAVNSFPLTAAPLFILGGMLMSEGKIAEKLFSFVEIWFRRVPSPLLVATIISGGIFCAITGSSVAATAAMSVICLPLLFARGYNKNLSCGTVAGATVGTLIPPSAGFILYGIVVGESVAQLFMAGVIPAVILFSLYVLYVVLRSILKPEQHQRSIERVALKDKFKSIKTGFWGLLAPIIVLSGIYFGIVTPTEAGGILVFYALVVGLFIHRTIKKKSLANAMLKSTNISLMILVIVVGASLYGSVISQNRVMDDIIRFAEAIKLSAPLFLIMMFIIILILGMFLEAIAIMLITLPLSYPLAMSLGINSLWFGVFYILNLEIGLLTPPVGLNLFVIRGVTDLPLANIIRGTLPFMMLMLLTLFIIYFLQKTVLWLPSTMF